MASRKDPPQNKSKRRRHEREDARRIRRIETAAEHRVGWRDLPDVISSWNDQPDAARTQAGNRLVQLFVWLVAAVVVTILVWMLFYNRVGVQWSTVAEIGETAVQLEQVAVERDLVRWRALTGLNEIAQKIPSGAEFVPNAASDEFAQSYFGSESGALNDLVNRQILFDRYAAGEVPAADRYQAALLDYAAAAGIAASIAALAEAIDVEGDALERHLRGLALEEYEIAGVRAGVPTEADQIKLLIIRSTDRKRLDQLEIQLITGGRQTIVDGDADDEGYSAFDYGYRVRSQIPPEYADGIWQQEVGTVSIFEVPDASDILFYVEDFEEMRPLEEDSLGQLQERAIDNFYLNLRSDSAVLTSQLDSVQEDWLSRNGLQLTADPIIADHYGIMTGDG